MPRGRHPRLIVDDLFTEMFDELQIAQLLSARDKPDRAIWSLEQVRQLAELTKQRLGGVGRRGSSSERNGGSVPPPPLLSAKARRG